MREPIMWRWGAIGYSMKLQMLLLRWEVIMKTKTKWELSAHVSSRSLDERTDLKARLMSPTCHHDVDITILFLVLKDASEEHDVSRMLCGDMYFCLPSPVLGLQNQHQG